MDDTENNGELRDPRLDRGVTIDTSSGSQRSQLHQMPDGKEVAPGCSMEEAGSSHGNVSPSCKKRVPSLVIAKSPHSSQSSSGGSPRKKHRAKLPLQSNTLLNYFGTPPSRKSSYDESVERSSSSPRGRHSDLSKSWGTSSRSPPPHYPAGQPRPKLSPDVPVTYSASSQPPPCKNHKEVSRSRHFSGGSSSSGGGNEKKSFPIIRPLIQRGPSYDEILRMAEENVDKQKTDRRVDHHHRISLSSDCSDDDKVPSKVHFRHRHSSDDHHRTESGRLSQMKSRHSSGSDRESHRRTLSNKHTHYEYEKNKLYEEILKRTPIIRIVKMPNTPSPVKITDELLKRCGSPGVLSDSGIINCDATKKDYLKRHHSADDMESDNGKSNYTVFKTTPKRQRSELEDKSSCFNELNLSTAELEKDKGNNSKHSECSTTKERPSSPDIAGPSHHYHHHHQESGVTGVRHLFRELSTPSCSSDNADSGTELKQTTPPKNKFNLANLQLDFNKLKNKIQLTPKRKSSTEEPMDLGTDSDHSMRSASSASPPGAASPDLSSTSTDCAQNNVDMDGVDSSPSGMSDADMMNTVCDGYSSKEDIGNNDENGRDDDMVKGIEGIETGVDVSQMDDQSSPGNPTEKTPEQSASTNLVRPRSLETLLACVEKSDEDLLASDEDSDDDFLMAKPSALQEIAQLSALPPPDTPEKSLSQISNDSLMQSPVHTSSVIPRNDRSKKLKFTLDSMMDLKAQDGTEESTDMTNYLQSNMQESGVVESDNITDLKARQQAKIEQYRIDNDQIPALHPGDNVFDSHKMGELFCFPDTLLLQDCGFNPIKPNAMEKLLLSATPDDLIELINSQCLREIFAAKPCPDSVMSWLFQLMSIHPSVYVTQNCFQTLWYLLTSCLSIHPNADPWVPSLKDVARVFINYGGNLNMLLPDCIVQPGFSMDDIRCVRGKENELCIDNEGSTSKRGVTCHDNYGLVGLPTVNVMEVIKIFTQVLITHGLKGRGTCYTPEELVCLLFLVSKTALDKQLIGLAVQVDFQLCISAILECFDDNIWDKQVPELCSTLCQISEHHHNLVYVVQLMPTNSQRGRLMRRRLSYAMLKKILASMSIPASSMMIQFGENGSIGNETVKVSDLLPILHACKPDADTDYYRLNSVITLIDLGVGNEPLKSLEKEDLERLILKLRELTGDIKDGFRYLNRVQVKDLMLRTVNKMTVLSQSMMSKQKSLFAYVKSIDEDAEEHLVESKDEAEMESSDEDEDDEAKLQGSDDAWNAHGPIPVINLDDSTSESL